MTNAFNTGILKNILAIFGILFSISMYAQQDNSEKLQKEAKKYIYEAQEAMSENDFASAEASYRKAIAKDPANTAAKYNMGNLYYNKEKTVSAEDRLKEATEVASTKDEKHKAFHNLGNSYMQMKDYQSAVEAFKNALRNNPTDEETRYNLALAKKMLEKQQNEDEQKDKDGNGEDNQEKDQQNKDEQNKDGEGGEDENEENQPKDEGEDDKDKKEGDKNEDNENDKGDEEKKEQPNEGDEKEQPQPQPAQGQLSPEQIKSLLEAMNNEEKKVQDKINAEKVKGVKVKSEKDW